MWRNLDLPTATPRFSTAFRRLGPGQGAPLTCLRVPPILKLAPISTSKISCQAFLGGFSPFLALLPRSDSTLSSDCHSAREHCLALATLLRTASRQRLTMMAWHDAEQRRLAALFEQSSSVCRILLAVPEEGICSPRCAPPPAHTCYST